MATRATGLLMSLFTHGQHWQCYAAATSDEPIQAAIDASSAGPKANLVFLFALVSWKPASSRVCTETRTRLPEHAVYQDCTHV
jgi:hypothetical protein